PSPIPRARRFARSTRWELLGCIAPLGVYVNKAHREAVELAEPDAAAELPDRTKRAHNRPRELIRLLAVVAAGAEAGDLGVEAAAGAAGRWSPPALIRCSWANW